MTVTLTKDQLRQIALHERAMASQADPLAGERLFANLPASGRPGAGLVVAGYVPTRSEIDPRPLMQALAEAGATLALPVTPPRGTEAPLSFRIWRAGDALTPGHFRIGEPGPGAPEIEPDLLLVPLLAFDSRGHRLGYGAGHYDRTLAALRASRPVRAIGLAFAAQEMLALPDGPFDQPLDAILTERAYIPTRSSAMEP